MTEPHRRWGMTRPWVLAPVFGIVVLTVLAATVAGALIAWVAWSLGGLLVGALFAMFDLK